MSPWNKGAGAGYVLGEPTGLFAGKEGAMYRIGYGKILLLFGLLTIGVIESGNSLAVAQSSGCNSNDPTAPCFANVSDILGGRTYLLRDDDLVVVAESFDSQNNSFFVTWGLQTTNSTITKQSDFSIPQGTIADQPQVAVAAGRMFSPEVTSDDVVASVGTVKSQLWLQVNDFGTNTTLFSTAVPTSLAYGQVDFAGMADFTRDGYEELVVHNTSGGLRIAQGTAGPALKWGPEFDTGPNGTLVGVTLPAAFALGDFLGNGGRQIVMVRPDPASVTGLVFTAYEVDPATLTITQASSVALPIVDSTARGLMASLAAGRFGTRVHDQLVLLYGSYFVDVPDVPVVNTTLMSIDVDSSLQPTIKGSYDFGASSAGFPCGTVVRNYKLDWFSRFDQAAVLFNGNPSSNPNDSVSVFGFSDDGTLTPAPLGATIVNAQFNGCVYDMAVGNFDNMQANPNPPPTTQRDANLQIALLGPSLNGFNPLQVAIYSVDSSSNNPTLTSSYTVASAAGFLAFPTVLAAADTRGRSLRLGPAEKATVTGHIQPDTILGVPPMHVDWITPVGGTTPTVLNLSVFPKTFNTQYSFAQTTGTQATRKSTTSYTVSTKESAQEKISYKPFSLPAPPARHG